MTFKSLPLTVRQIKATEATLERIYEAAYLGLKGDSLALAAGMLPTEFNRLKELDQIAHIAELKGRADSERANSQALHAAAAAGDSKAALEILKHSHKWTAPQSVSVTVDQKISITAALAAAEKRVFSVLDAGIIDEAPDRANDQGLLINNRNKDGDDYQHSNARPASRSTEL